jgi:hypothetical protein
MATYKYVTTEHWCSGGHVMMGFHLEQFILTVILIAVLFAYKFNVGLDGNKLKPISSTTQLSHRDNRLTFLPTIEPVYREVVSTSRPHHQLDMQR